MLDLQNYAIPRHRMVQSQLRDRGIRDERVLAAMDRVPRHEFVATQFHPQAYEDTPLPLDEGQTISQPYIVAFMLEALHLAPHYTVLEIGTGSGYQTALLAELVARVVSIERHSFLAHKAKQVLTRFGYNNVILVLGDGTQGAPASGPYDAIIVGAAAPGIPPALFEQLREDGRMVLPIGPPGEQELQLVEKRSGEPVVSSLVGCRFVPLIGEQGYRED
jgi:protein-L-isoaspartate(D-aspartate) O-methyltransferase